MLPNFIVIGAPKCGTTTLCDLLAQHPEIFMCTPKEPRFFSHDHVYDKGYAWYKSLFRPGRGSKLIGEGSTSYAVSLSDEIASSRIAQHIPDARLIYCVRHPVRRIESIWMEYASQGSFGSQEAGRLKLSRDFSSTVRFNPAFVDTSCYWERLNVYRRKFPDSKIHVIFLKDLELRQQETLAACYRFLGCDPDVATRQPPMRSNVSSKKRAPTRIGTLLNRLPQIMPVRLARRILVHISPSIIAGNLSRPSWDAELYHQVVGRLKADAKSFLAYCEKPDDFWDFT